MQTTLFARPNPHQLQAAPASGAVAAPAVARRARAHLVFDRALIRTARGATGGGKRVFDFTLSILIALMATPFLLAIAVAIKMSDGGPAMFGHVRIGRHGARFICWKFRTMRVDAEAALARLLETDPQAALEWRTHQKLANDVRVTKLGRFLRATSLDELPQLFNVIKGDMSLIGPRPITRGELDRFGDQRRFYLLVRPGVTGLWQVSGRSRLAFADRVRLDRLYAETWSPWRDLTILIRTVWVVLRRDGAC